MSLFSFAGFSDGSLNELGLSSHKKKVCTGMGRFGRLMANSQSVWDRPLSYISSQRRSPRVPVKREVDSRPGATLRDALRFSSGELGSVIARLLWERRPLKPTTLRQAAETKVATRKEGKMGSQGRIAISGRTAARKAVERGFISIVLVMRLMLMAASDKMFVLCDIVSPSRRLTAWCGRLEQGLR
ncbi:hypothetical protein BX600DRAFT_1757 [Xylariales sp. PMI_506]|nr:hypothetical protein BX600DRAFT_1757 [Xylariales sp. PMI_506]